MISLLTTLLLSAPVAVAAPENVITISLPIEASVDGAEIALGDIATVAGEVEVEVQSIRDFTLGYAPAPGYSRVIQRWRVEQQLTREFPGLHVQFEGKAACRVWPRTAEISDREIELAARKSLEGQFVGQDVSIELHGELVPETVPAGRSGRRVEANAENAKIQSGTISVPVKLIVDEVKYRTVWVSFDVTVFREIPVLNRPIPTGGKIKNGDFVLRRMAVEASFSDAQLTPTMLIGAKARHPLSSGMPVNAHDVERERAVIAGETIALEVVNGAVTVKTKVLAMADGYVGDVVVIRTLATGKELTAVVVGVGRLRLRLGKTRNN